MATVFAERRPIKVWAVQFRKFENTSDGQVICRQNTEEIKSFCEQFGYKQCVYMNCNDCIAINCHGKMSVLTDGDMLVRDENNHLSVMSICDFGKLYHPVENPGVEYAIEVAWPGDCDILPTTYTGGRYNSLEVVTAMLQSKKDEIGLTDELIAKATEILSKQLPQMGVINSERCAIFSNDKNCIVKCWRSK